MRRSLPVVLGAALVGLGAAIPARPAAPTVSGPRETTASRPVYTFRARGAVGFRCAFDGVRLHRCAARYSERLAPGRHVLRVRSVGRSGALSRVIAVMVHVLEPVPALTVAPAIEVGTGVGVPAAAGGAVWVPATTEGALVRVAGGAVVGRTPVGPVPPGPGFLDSAVATDGAVWAASDAGARIVRVDPSSGAATAQLSVPDRPGGLAAGGGAVWAFHFLHGTVTRIDPATAAASRLAVGNARATGIAFGAGALWLLSTAPAQLLELDPATGAARRTIPLQPPFGPRRAFIDSWSLAFGEGALWAALPNHDAIARVDAASGETLYVQLRQGRPFGVATGGGSAWVATDRGVVRLDGATGAVAAASALPPADRSGFVSLAYGDGAAWLTNYDRGTLVRVTASP
jgi:virginiamycin B lyase